VDQVAVCGVHLEHVHAGADAAPRGVAKRRRKVGDLFGIGHSGHLAANPRVRIKLGATVSGFL